MKRTGCLSQTPAVKIDGMMARTHTIAIVDDDEGVRNSLGSLLRSLGYEVRSYDSAIGFLADGRADPCCMITDIQMPEMNGDELQERLVAAGRRIPTIFMTAFPTEATRSRVMASGAIAYLDKPVDGNLMADCLADILAGGE